MKTCNVSTLAENNGKVYEPRDEQSFKEVMGYIKSFHQEVDGPYLGIEENAADGT